MNVLYIMDLGFAWPAPTAIEKRRVDFMGTPDYSSSDALRGRRQSYKDDMESLGYTLLEMWLGDLPWFLTAGPSAQGGWTNQTLTRMANKRERKVKALIKVILFLQFVSEGGCVGWRDSVVCGGLDFQMQVDEHDRQAGLQLLSSIGQRRRSAIQ